MSRARTINGVRDLTTTASCTNMGAKVVANTLTSFITTCSNSLTTSSSADIDFFYAPMAGAAAVKTTQRAGLRFDEHCSESLDKF